MPKGGRRGKGFLSKRTDAFNPDDAEKVKYTRIGVWDVYEEHNPVFTKLPGTTWLEPYMQMWNDLPYLWRMMQDLSTLRSCWLLLGCYVLVTVAEAMIPALSLWYSSRLVDVVQMSIDARTVDKTVLFQAAGGRFMCSFLQHMLRDVKRAVVQPLNSKIRQYYSVHVFRAMARLDVPTSEDAAVTRQLEAALPSSQTSVAWDAIQTILQIFSAVIQFFSQSTVLLHILLGQRDGLLLSGLSVVTYGLQFTNFRQHYSRFGSNSGVWAATTKEPDFVLMQGLKKVVSRPEHRQEIVAGGMWQHMLALFSTASARLGPDAADFREARARLQGRMNLPAYFSEAFTHLPQVVFTLRAVQYPASIPVSLASLNMITESSTSFMVTLIRLFDGTSSFAEKLTAVRKLYEISNIPNRIPDGTLPYPENNNSLSTGIAIEFRNVCFRYPGGDQDALHDLSFKILKGQLCVIVGENGSGKSTILKLITRIYEPYKGEIFIDGIDIRSLKLADLRAAISVLFQDYTHFPLSIKDNIGLGDPVHAHDQERIRTAAELGGAIDIIEKLPEGFDTFLERPVEDHYSSLPEGTTTLFGRTVNFGRIRGQGGLDSRDSRSLSGGQLQRLALSRTFMRSVGNDDRVGLLLFDEPSASLDPSAEHDLFNRLRALRGSKTMLFSSHRFGNLTRHADLLLYMSNSTVIEEGTHEQLIKRGGRYAEIWNLQVQSFLG